MGGLVYVSGLDCCPVSDLLLILVGPPWSRVEDEDEVARLTKRLLEFVGLRHVVRLFSFVFGSINGAQAAG